MWCSYGNINFNLLNAPDSFSHTDETEYVTHDLIGLKPVLQPAANSLEQYELSFSLQSEFCNVANTIKQLKDLKDNFSAEPLLMGNGSYLGDFVITSLNTEVTETFDDGTIIKAFVTLSLLEFLTADKLQQQQNAARKNAFAIGDKKPVITGLVQPATIPQHGSVEMAAVNSETLNINKNVLQYQDNVSKQEYIKSQIKKSIQNINNNLDDFNNNIDDIKQYYTDATGLVNSLKNMSDTAQNFSFNNIDEIQLSNLNLQQANTQLQTAIVPLNYNIIDRRA